MLLDLRASLLSPTVDASVSPPLVDLQHLYLDDARALLDQEMAMGLPSAEQSATAHLQGIINGLCQLSLKDPLTGMANRRHFLTVLERAIDMVARTGETTLLLMLDIDHFKRVNDSYGHHAGDLVLQSVSRSLARCVRPMDTVARFGGEEFAIVLPNCNPSFGLSVAERIRESIESLVTPISPGLSVKVTVSVGGAYAPEWVRSTTALWTERADIQLYRAKREGRNRVFLDEQQEIFVSAEEKSLLFGNLSLADPWLDGVAVDLAGAAAAPSEQRFN